MDVKTYLVYLPQWDNAFNQEILIDFQKKIDQKVGNENTGININYTPFNEVTKFTVAVWALGLTEKDNKMIIDKVEKFLEQEKIEYIQFESCLKINEEKVYIEIENCPRF